VAAFGAEPGPGLARFEFDETHMGSSFHIVLYSTDEATARRASLAAFARVAELDATLSDYKPESELMRLCREAGGPPVPVSADLFRVLDASKRMSERSGGAFDVTVAPVVRLWRRARRERKLPDADLLSKALALVGSDAMHLDAGARTVELRKPGMKLDVGGMAKGYAAGEAIATLKRHGIDRALVAAAGDIVVSGPPPGSDGWTVAIAPLESSRARPSFSLCWRGRPFRPRATPSSSWRSAASGILTSSTRGPAWAWSTDAASPSSRPTARPPTAWIRPPTSSVPNVAWRWSRRPREPPL
jgi:thiamine biosynthesis lipoprotein